MTLLIRAGTQTLPDARDGVLANGFAHLIQVIWQADHLKNT